MFELSKKSWGQWQLARPERPKVGYHVSYCDWAKSWRSTFSTPDNSNTANLVLLLHLIAKASLRLHLVVCKWRPGLHAVTATVTSLL